MASVCACFSPLGRPQERDTTLARDAPIQRHVDRGGTGTDAAATRPRTLSAGRYPAASTGCAEKSSASNFSFSRQIGSTRPAAKFAWMT